MTQLVITMRNARLPIMRLPPVIFEIILNMLRSEIMLSRDINAEFPDNVGEMSHEWLRVAHVCHSWRNAVLSCSSLWTTVSVRERSESIATNRALDFSCNRLLTVQICAQGDEEGKQNAVVVALSQLPRIKELHLSGALRVAEHELLATLEAPFLETLNLTAGFTSQSGLSFNAELPPLFRGNVKAVKNLRVSIMRPFGSNNFTNLRQLLLRQQPHWSQQDFQSLLDFLERNQLLEDLMITALFLTEDFLALNPSKRCISMPALRRICLDGHYCSFQIKPDGGVTCDIRTPTATSGSARINARKCPKNGIL